VAIAPRIAQAQSFLKERTGYPWGLDAWKNRSLPGGQSWGQALGFGVMALILLQVFSGLAMTLFYSPSTSNAWASVVYFEQEIPFGTLIRGLHYHGTNALLIVTGLHLLYVVLNAGYRRPREVTWWVGLVLVLVIIGFAMTGALLPWDDQGFWASRVEIGIMGTVPLIGGLVQQVALGGNDLGNTSLTRYYTIHAIILPLVLVGIVYLHFTLIRMHPAGSATPRRHGATTYWPRQAARDAAFSLFVVLVVFGIAAKFAAPLEAPADPSGGFPARPVWYFRPLFELRRFFEGPTEPVATMLLPGLFGGFLAALPFLDRGRTWKQRLPFVAPVLGVAALAVFAASYSLERDARDKGYQDDRAEARSRADRARLAARAGVPPQGALYMVQNTPEAHGAKLYADRCIGCHAISGKGTDKPKGPDLGGYGSHDWLVGVIAHPEAPEFFGHSKVGGMDQYEKLGPTKLAALAAFLGELRKYPNTSAERLPASFKSEIELYQSEGCDSCHSLTPGEASGASNLSGYGSEAWLVGLFLTPSADVYFGSDNEMPSYKDKLSERDMHDIIAYLNLLRDKRVQYQAPVAEPAEP
jgi:ubiquinol-cytochrome c reductase cytochrome b subunit